MSKLGRRNFLSSGGGFATALLTAFAPASSAREPAGAPPAHSEGLNGFLAAVIAGDVDAVNAFLAQDDALLYARDHHGQSAYLLAAYAGRAEVIKIFESRNIVLDVYEAASAARLDR